MDVPLQCYIVCLDKNHTQLHLFRKLLLFDQRKANSRTPPLVVVNIFTFKFYKGKRIAGFRIVPFVVVLIKGRLLYFFKVLVSKVRILNTSANVIKTRMFWESFIREPCGQKTPPFGAKLIKYNKLFTCRPKGPYKPVSVTKKSLHSGASHSAIYPLLGCSSANTETG